MEAVEEHSQVEQLLDDMDAADEARRANPSPNPNPDPNPDPDPDPSPNLSGGGAAVPRG